MPTAVLFEHIAHFESGVEQSLRIKLKFKMF